MESLIREQHDTQTELLADTDAREQKLSVEIEQLKNELFQTSARLRHFIEEKKAADAAPMRDAPVLPDSADGFYGEVDLRDDDDGSGAAAAANVSVAAVLVTRTCFVSRLASTEAAASISCTALVTARTQPEQVMSGTRNTGIGFS